MTYTSAQVTEASLNWYADRTPAKLNTLILTCQFPVILALQKVGAKLRRRPDLTTDDLKHEGLVGIWKMIIRDADKIAAFTQRPDRNGLVTFFKQAAIWQMMAKLSEPGPTEILSVDDRKKLGKLRGKAMQIKRCTGIYPTDVQLAESVDLRATWTIGMLAKGRPHLRIDQKTFDGNDPAWMPPVHHRDFDRLENRELLAKALRAESKRERWFLRHHYLLGQTTREMRPPRPRRVSLTSPATPANIVTWLIAECPSPHGNLDEMGKSYFAHADISSRVLAVARLHWSEFIKFAASLGVSTVCGIDSALVHKYKIYLECLGIATSSKLVRYRILHCILHFNIGRQNQRAAKRAAAHAEGLVA